MACIWRLKRLKGLIQTFRNHQHVFIHFKWIGVIKMTTRSLKCTNQTVCFCFRDHFCVSVTKSLLLQVPLNHVHFSHLRVRVTLHITTQSGSSVLRLKWPPSPNKDASLSKAPHSTMNLVSPPPSLLPSHCNLSCQLPRFVFGSDPSPSVE